MIVLNMLFFYSKSCEHSNMLYSIIENSKIDNVNYICVDKKDGLRPKSVYTYKVIEVPTIINDNIRMTGDQAFSYVENIVSENLKPKGFSSIEKKEEATEISAYSTEFSGYSDNFSFIGDDKPLERSFEFLGTSKRIEADSNTRPTGSNETKATPDDFERMLQERAMLNNELNKQKPV